MGEANIYMTRKKHLLGLSKAARKRPTVSPPSATNVAGKKRKAAVEVDVEKEGDDKHTFGIHHHIPMFYYYLCSLGSVVLLVHSGL